MVRLVEKEPTTEAISKVAKAQLLAGRSQDAIDTLEAWLKDYPTDEVTRFRLADMYIARGRWTEARDRLVTLLKRLPNSAMALNNLAWTLVQLNETDEALVHAKHANELVPGNSVIINTLGLAYLRRGEPGEALPYLEKAVQLSPENPDFRYHHARTLAESGQTETARKILETVLAEPVQFPGRRAATALLASISEESGE